MAGSARESLPFTRYGVRRTAFVFFTINSLRSSFISTTTFDPSLVTFAFSAITPRIEGADLLLTTFTEVVSCAPAAVVAPTKSADTAVMNMMFLFIGNFS